MGAKLEWDDGGGETAAKNNATRGFGLLGMLLAFFGGIGMLCAGKLGNKKKIAAIIVAMAGLCAVISAVIGSQIIKDNNLWDTFKLGYSFWMTLVGGAFCLVSGAIFFFRG